MALSKSYNLENLCLQLNSSWQYIDRKLNGGLNSILENAPIPDSILNKTPTDHSTCTIYALVKEMLYGASKNDVMTVKNFFNGFNSQWNQRSSLSFKEKENIYWKIRLRYGCGIIPIAVIYIAKELKKIGYTSWLLPNGEIIPFDSLWLITFHAVPNSVNVVKSVITMDGRVMNTIDETIENIGPDFGNGSAIQHTILGSLLSSGEKFVLDPTSMQFDGLRKGGHKLLYYGSWEEYMNTFPGKCVTLMYGGWAYEKSIEAMLYKVGNNPSNPFKPGSPGFIDDLIEKTLKVIDAKFCAHCGETGLRLKLLSCSRCKNTVYCDAQCQKTDWKFHKSNTCIP